MRVFSILFGVCNTEFGGRGELYKVFLFYSVFFISIGIGSWIRDR